MEGALDAGVAATLAAAEQHMLTAPIEMVRSFHLRPADPGGGHQAKYSVALSGGQVCLAKAAPPGDLNQLAQTRHEVAAWELLKALGWADLGATTVLREIDLAGVGLVPAALQTAWPSEMCVNAPDISCMPSEVTFRAAIFDYVILNSDRGGHNWLGLDDGAGAVRLKLFDHGHCFGLHGGEVSSNFVSKHMGDPLADADRTALRHARTSGLPRVIPHVAADAVEALTARMDKLLESERMPGSVLAA